MIARIDAAIAAARRGADVPILSAVVYQPGGLTAGGETISDELMHIVGLANVAARHGVRQHRAIALEALLMDPPDILLVGETSPGAAMHAERIVHHRAFRAFEGRMQRASYPAKLLYCAGPTMIEALDALVAARSRCACGARQERRVMPYVRVGCRRDWRCWCCFSVASIAVGSSR